MPARRSARAGTTTAARTRATAETTEIRERAHVRLRHWDQLGRGVTTPSARLLLGEDGVQYRSACHHDDRARQPHRARTSSQGRRLASLPASYRRCEAVAELSWLLDRGYPKKAALKLVGDRHALRDRQRMAVQRCAASGADRELRRARQVESRALAGETLMVDGYNVLLTVEAALSGGVLLLGGDGVVRDLTSMSGHYRRMRSTRPALEAIAHSPPPRPAAAAVALRSTDLEQRPAQAGDRHARGRGGMAVAGRAGREPWTAS